MPCGGIAVYSDVSAGDCWVCNKPGAKHYLEEWDAMIHARCAVKELANPTSDVALVINHKHQVFLDFGLEEEK
jgi:hypothetical protein